MSLVVYTVIEAPDRGWTSPASIAGFVGSVVLLGLFVAQERRTGHPMLDVRLFKDMRFTAASGSVTIAFFTLFGFILYLRSTSSSSTITVPFRPGCTFSRWRSRSPWARSWALASPSV